MPVTRQTGVTRTPCVTTPRDHMFVAASVASLEMGLTVQVNFPLIYIMFDTYIFNT